MLRHILLAMEVIYTNEFEDWFVPLDGQHKMSIVQAVLVLEEKGVTLGFPRSSSLEGSRYPIRELRIQSGGDAIRIAYAFDPRRDAVLIIGGIKGGMNDARFYRELISKAETIWKDYLAEQLEGLHDESE